MRRYPMNGPSMTRQSDYYEGRISGREFRDYCARIHAGETCEAAEKAILTVKRKGGR